MPQSYIEREGIDIFPVDRMSKPNLEGLRKVAVFDVGDDVFLGEHTKPWKITARYWSPSQQSIVYDLVYPYNGLEMHRRPERELRRTVWNQYAKDQST